jgi:predicted phosphodiesterase
MPARQAHRSFLSTLWLTASPIGRLSEGMRIAHLTDLHITQLPPDPRGFLDRRISGALNLKLLGRGERYRDSADRGRHAVAQIIAENPDAVVFGGDATSLSEPSEFAGAAEVLAPLLELGVPCFALAGNHDRYTKTAEKERRFEQAFSAWRLFEPGWHNVEIGGLPISFVDTARANSMIWDSRGRRIVPPNPPPRLVFAHYGILDHRAEPDRKWHALRDEESLRVTLRDGPGTTWCCGHLHRSFSSRAGGLIQFCAGSVGGPLGAWQMIELIDGEIRRRVWSKEGQGRLSKLR